MTPVRRRGKARHLRGRRGSTDPRKIQAWWTQWPDANIGLVLTDLGLFAFDTDGEAGEHSLERLVAEAGIELPPTYEEHSGRDGGGRHLLLWLPPGCPPLVTQYGTRERHPGLDVLTANFIVVAGSVHKTGSRYSNAAGRPPLRSEVAVMPRPLYDLLAQRLRRRKPDRTTPQTSASVSATTPRVMDDVLERLPRTTRNMLVDTSDGRNLRAYRVVCTLLDRGWDDESIVTLVLGSPLGDKARERDPRDPGRWVHQKITSARAAGVGPFDAQAFWVAAHTAGLSSPQLRVLDYLLGRSRWRGGRIRASYDVIGIGSAMADPRDHLTRLEDLGWVSVLDAPPPGSGAARLYRLSVPAAATDKPRTWLVPPTTPLQLEDLYLGFRAYLAGHDAFRRAKGSLHLSYPLLTLLGARPVQVADLARALQSDPVHASRLLRPLLTAGLAVEDHQGVRAVRELQQGRLTSVAVEAGTHGQRAQARTAYAAKVVEWQRQKAEHLRERQQPGSTLWLKETTKELREYFADDACTALREVYADAGRSLDDLVAVVLHDRLVAETRRQVSVTRLRAAARAAAVPAPGRVA